MANPLIHSKSSVKLWGGVVEDYIPLTKWIVVRNTSQIIDTEH